MEQKPTKNRDKIVAAAIELFKQEGYSNVSVNQICKAAKIGRSSFYAIFSSKDDIILHLYSDDFTKSEQLMDQFVSAENDLERIWLLYDYFLSLAISVGPVVSSSLMIIELNRNAGIYDSMMKVRKWSIPLCENCQKQGIIRNTAKAEDLLPMVSSSLNNLVFEWCRCKGKLPLRKRSRLTIEVLFDVDPDYRKTKAD